MWSGSQICNGKLLIGLISLAHVRPGLPGEKCPTGMFQGHAATHVLYVLPRVSILSTYRISTSATYSHPAGVACPTHPPTRGRRMPVGLSATSIGTAEVGATPGRLTTLEASVSNKGRHLLRCIGLVIMKSAAWGRTHGRKAHLNLVPQPSSVPICTRIVPCGMDS